MDVKIYTAMKTPLERENEAKARALRLRELKAEMRFLEELQQIAEDGGYGAVEVEFDRPLSATEEREFAVSGQTHIPYMTQFS